MTHPALASYRVVITSGGRGDLEIRAHYFRHFRSANRLRRFLNTFVRPIFRALDAQYTVEIEHIRPLAKRFVLVDEAVPPLSATALLAAVMERDTRLRTLKIGAHR